MRNNFFWLNRTTLEEIAATPEDMERKFGQSFRDVLGQPASNAEWINAPNLFAVLGWPKRYWNVVGDAVSLYSGAERNAIDASLLAQERDRLADQIDRTGDVVRALVLAFIDEFNRHSLVEAEMFDAVEAATSLADLKARFAAITQISDRDAAQLKQVLRSKLDA